VLVTLYNREEMHAFSNRAGVMYINGLGNIDTGMFETSTPHYEIGSRRFRVRRSTLMDVAESIERSPQVILAKDALSIGLELDLPFVERMLEIGGGNGGFSIISSIAFKVKIKSYESSVENFKLLMKNLRRFEAEGMVEAVNADGREADVDAFESIFIDHPEPWIFLDCELHPPKKVASVLPTYSQAEEFSRFLLKKDFLVNTHQVIEIPHKLSKIGMRPETMVMYHTGFIVSGKKW
jgi:tRNA A58 N-methylase Trm61